MSPGHRFKAMLCASSCLLGAIPTYAEPPPASPYANELIGRCFPSPRASIEAISGVVDPADANVVAQRADVTTGSHWIIDKTSEHNYQWYLLERMGGRHCVTLYIPFASEVRTVHRTSSVSIVALTQASPGRNRYGMVFRRSPSQGRFVPVKCTRSADSSHRNSAPPTPIDCLAVGD